MKTHVKLLVLAMVLVMFTFCLAACVGGGGDSTTTTTEPTVTTTTAPTASYDPTEFGVVVDEEVGYTGSALDVVDILVPGGVRTSITYVRLNADGTVAEELGKTKPTNVGTYKVTVEFFWQKAGKTDPLPAPMSDTFAVVPGSLAAQKDDFGAKDIEILYKNAGMDFDPLTSALITGFVPDGIVRSATIQKLADKDATSGEAIGSKITSTNGAGYYLVTVTYAEEAGADNFNDENTVSHTAKVYARAIEKTVAYKTGLAVDGDLTKYGAALFTTEYQPYTTKDDGKGNTIFDKIDTANLVDPYEKAALLRIQRGAAITDQMEKNAATAKFYAAWDGANIYVAIEVTDATAYARSVNYTSQPNPWVNDNLEFYYSFGGDAIPDMSIVNETYPTYKTVVRDSVTGTKGFSGIGSQRSHYFNQIECKVIGREVTGNNTYIIEYKFPAKSESWSGTPGASGDQAFKTAEGSALKAGDFLYLAFQLNDLMGVPYKRLNKTSGALDFKTGELSTEERWATIEEYDANITSLPGQKYGGNDFATSPDAKSEWYNFEYDAAAYVYAAGNRDNVYLNQAGCAPMILQLGAAQ